MTEHPDLSAAVRAVAGGVELAVFCQPRAARTAVVGRHGGMVKVKVREAALDGNANEALLRLLAAVLGVARAEVSLCSGDQSRMKRIRAAGIGRQAALAALEAAATAPEPGHISG
jgi:uncharacterized protein (TIGR00251 family)